MNLFSKFFKKPDSKVASEPKPLAIDASQTPEKFRHFQDEVFNFLIPILKSLHELEANAQKKMEALEKKRSSPNQVHPDEDGVWNEYIEKSKQIIAPVSFKPYGGHPRSIGKPTSYEYLTYPNSKFYFIMKSENRAVVEVHFEYGMAEKNQFVLKKVENDWKIDSRKYGFPDEETWHTDEL